MVKSQNGDAGGNDCGSPTSVDTTCRPHRVFWSIAATKQLRQALRKQGRNAKDAKLLSLFDELLTRAFPASTVFVSQRLGGFDSTKPQHVLMIEVFPDADAQRSQRHHDRVAAYVIKIGLESNIQAELAGWNAVEPVGGDDSILLPLYDCPTTLADASGNIWKAIRYADASRTIGTGTAVSLESAVIDGSQHNLPTAQSICLCVQQVMMRLAASFHGNSCEESWSNERAALWVSWIADAPFEAQPATKRFSETKLGQTISAWRSRRHAPMIWQAQQILHTIHQERSRTRTCPSPVEAVDAYDQMIQLCMWAADSSERPECPVPALLSAAVPSMLRGCAHGDLHGRNILVGKYRDVADNPTVFDYELSGSDRLIVWDFAKLELELKTRALARILSGLTEPEFTRSVTEFERGLDTETTTAIQHSWKVLMERSDSPLQRLAKIVLTLRREAAAALGSDRRAGNWYDEYLFQLGLCAIMSVRYGNKRRIQLANYLSACIAVEKSHWHEKLSKWDNDRYGEEFEAADPISLPLPISAWQAPHGIANRWMASGEARQFARAERLLALLTEQFPHVPRLWEDRVLVLLQLGRHEEASGILQDFEERYDSLTEELLCRFGRIQKERGHQWFDAGNWSAAIPCYESSIRFYGDAHALHRGHYPGINMASLQLAVAACYQHLQREAEAKRNLWTAQRTAKELLETADQWPTVMSEDRFWHLATLAEAHLIAGEVARAELLYQQVDEHPEANRRALQSVHGQKARNQANAAVVKSFPSQER